MSIQIPSGFEGVLYDQADRALRLEAKKWRGDIDRYREAAGYFERGENWLSWYLLPFPSSLAGRNLPDDLLARMEYVNDSIELDEPGAKAEAARLLHQAADTLEGISRERFGLGGFAEAAE